MLQATTRLPLPSLCPSKRMDHVLLSSSNGTLPVVPTKEAYPQILNSFHDEESPLFFQFPSPFLDDVSATSLLANPPQHHLDANQYQTTNISSENKPLSITDTLETEPSPPSKSKRVKKKRSPGKKDRHSKIHTAQGLRDRRMRLSLHIARKFFDLQDMLGFDKASKTIEWLFCKSRKAIKEVTESLQSQKDETSQSVSREIQRSKSPSSGCEIESTTEITTGRNKDKNSKGETKHRESRDKARARARERTRERTMIKCLDDKSKQLLGANPNDDFDLSGLGFSTNPNNRNMEEPLISSPLGYSSHHHFLHHLPPANNVEKVENYLGSNGSSSAYCSMFDYYPSDTPASWLNSSNKFLGFLGECDVENLMRMESYNHEEAGNVYGQNPSSILVSTSNLVHFQSQNQEN